MEKDVAIVGYAQTRYEPSADASRELMVAEAAIGALNSAGITRDEIDTVITSSNDYMDGRTISNMRLVEVAGGWLKDESKAEMDGNYSALYGAMRVLSGDHEVAMVIGVSQPSAFPTYIPGVMTLDPTFDRERWLLNEVSAAALQARAYMEEYGVTEEQIARVAVKNLRNAALNPLAPRQRQVLTLEDVMDSRMLYSPIRELTAYPPCDGACSVLLASAEKAVEITDSPVWIKGIGFSHDSYLTERPLAAMGSLELAARRAYEAAGISDPGSELDLVEINENFAHEELMAYEALGFCKAGEGAGLLESGATEMSGRLPVNASGGGLAANVPCAVGLARLVEAAMQIKGEAGMHQVPDVNVALAHGQTGLCAQENIVFVLGGD